MLTTRWHSELRDSGPAYPGFACAGNGQHPSEGFMPG